MLPKILYNWRHWKIQQNLTDYSQNIGQALFYGTHYILASETNTVHETLSAIIQVCADHLTMNTSIHIKYSVATQPSMVEYTSKPRRSYHDLPVTQLAVLAHQLS